MSNNSGIKDPYQRVLVYSLLVVGSIVFCWPLLWMAFSSVKAGNELFARKQHFLPETPATQLRSPFVDEQSFADIDNKRQAEVLSWLESAIKPQIAALVPDLDADKATKQMARGAYQRLIDSLPQFLRNLTAQSGTGSKDSTRQCGQNFAAATANWPTLPPTSRQVLGAIP